MMMELGRGPIDFKIITITTALDEEVLDLPMASRGFWIKDRADTAVLRVSNIKGEVSEASDGKFWTVRTGGSDGAFFGLRVMREDAEDGQGNALGTQADGTVLEQRYYVTSESANTDIEVVIIPGY